MATSPPGRAALAQCALGLGVADQGLLVCVDALVAPQRALTRYAYPVCALRSVGALMSPQQTMHHTSLSFPCSFAAPPPDFCSPEDLSSAPESSLAAASAQSRGDETGEPEACCVLSARNPVFDSKNDAQICRSILDFLSGKGRSTHECPGPAQTGSLGPV